MRPARAFALGILLAGCLGLFCGGCAGYRLGPTNGTFAGERSAFVEVFTNETLQPRLEDDLTRAVRTALQREGTFRLANRRDSDVIVRGVITSYQRQGLSYQPGDLATVRDYNLLLTVHVSMIERASGKVLIEQDVTGVTQARAGEDLGSAEREAAPLLAENLARKVTDLLADGTW